MPKYYEYKIAGYYLYFTSYLPWYMAIFFKQEHLSEGLTYEVDLSGL